MLKLNKSGILISFMFKYIQLTENLTELVDSFSVL